MTKDQPQDQSWQVIAAARREQLELLIPKEWKLSKEFKASLPTDGRLIQVDPARKSGILSEAELDITENYSAAQLLERLARSEVSSLAVTTAFCKRAAIAQQLVGVLADNLKVYLTPVIDFMPDRTLLFPSTRAS